MIKEIIVIKSEYEKLKTDNETMKKALKEIAEFDCSDDCYSTAYEALIETDEDFKKNISKVNEFIDEQVKKINPFPSKRENHD
ncbi:hypothetical protein LMG8526HA_00213 [Lactococcus lactis]|uniref:hypothetical protein n=1 Tax=Lactococcus lactis TaxID=1358 RepID=UPI0007293F3A|nr:hypothetical protein [Lactococcus lactis]KSU12984.1 Phage protein [Lactococcus lactis subsp. lactis]MDU0399376.1 hypothetical protein [Lactococcus lactis]